jgi:hypothetical protein
VKQLRRLYASTFFGTVLLLPLLAIVFLQAGQAYIKSTRDERLEKGKQVQVVLPAKEVVWEEEGKELWVGNRMFDVSSYTVTNDQYYLIGVYDDHETAVAGTLLHAIYSKNGADLLRLLLLLQCFTCCFAFIHLLRNDFIKNKQHSFYVLFFPSPLHLVLGPPPRQ